MEQVGMKLLGRRSTGVQPERSRKPARTALAWMRSRRKLTVSWVAHLRQDSVLEMLFLRFVISVVSLQRSHLTERLRVETSRSSMPYSSIKGKESAVPFSGL